jgi:hypothetical protein
MPRTARSEHRLAPRSANWSMRRTVAHTVGYCVIRSCRLMAQVSRQALDRWGARRGHPAILAQGPPGVTASSDAVEARSGGSPVCSIPRDHHGGRRCARSGLTENQAESAEKMYHQAQAGPKKMASSRKGRCHVDCS